MNYSEYRPNIKSGDLIIFSIAKMRSMYDLPSYIIRLLTLSEYNHVGIAWSTGDRRLLVEAQIPEIKISPLKKMGSFYHIPMGIDFTDRETEILLDKVGQKYSYSEVIKALFKKNIYNDENWICVDLVKYFYQAVNIDVGEVSTPSDVVANIVKKLNKPIIYVDNKTKV